MNSFTFFEMSHLFIYKLFKYAVSKPHSAASNCRMMSVEWSDRNLRRIISSLFWKD
jgi:hypothetical protein